MPLKFLSRDLELSYLQQETALHDEQQLPENNEQ
jgi:hypothetical protein